MIDDEVVTKVVPVTVASLSVSLRRMDGGGMRAHAFLRALEKEGCTTDVVALGPQEDGMAKLVSSPLHKLKRRMLPIALRRRVEAELQSTSAPGPTLSLIPTANRWALGGTRSWLDFPDLCSNIAVNHARTVDVFSGVLNGIQGRLWSKREVEEYERADVVSVASWSDARQLGDRAVWLPTPVSDGDGRLHRRRPRRTEAQGVTYGMLANFHYPPNVDAYERLVHEWLPLLLPTASRILVAGFGSEALPRVPDVDVVGAVDAVTDFYDLVDLVVVPIERGGGMKVKVVEAMMHGVPVMATRHASEGLPPEIAGACVTWGDPWAERRDPREDPAVARALVDFTTESFQKKFSISWNERMSPDG